MSLLSALPSRQSFTTSTGNTYSYLYILPTGPKKPTLLFLHGFPSHIADWIYQLTYFSRLGYGVVALDLLGYGQSSKPTEINVFRLKAMSDELFELLSQLGIGKIVGIGHDFGSTLLSRFAAYYPDHLVACIFLAVGPPKLGTPFNVDAINAMTKQQLGCEMLGYIPFIARHPLAQALMEKNCESVMGLLFCSDEGKEWKEHFRPLGAFEKFVTEGQTVEVAEWFGGELREAHLQAFGCQGGYAGAKGWYGMWDQELFMQDELGNEGAKIEIPSLFVGGAGDTDVQSDFLSEWVTNLTVEKVKSGHWVHIERPEKVNKLIADFLHQQDILIAGLFN